MTTLEREVERDLVRMVKRHGGRCLKFVSPGAAGVPDRLILLPGGRAYFAEIKRPHGGRRDTLQVWWAKELHALGFGHAWITCREDVERLERVLIGGGRLAGDDV